jgi:hypothetical protein
MMSFPKATEDKVGEKNTLVEGLYCMSYIRGNLSGFKLDLAKKFLKFAYTNASLVDFATITSTPRGVKTTYTETDLSKMTYFGRSVINLANRSDVVFPVSTKPIYLANQSTFNNKYTFVASIKGTTYNDPTAILRPSDINHKSAKEFFLGIGARYTNWATDYAQWFN